MYLLVSLQIISEVIFFRMSSILLRQFWIKSTKIIIKNFFINIYGRTVPTLLKNSLKKFTPVESLYEKSQFIGSADRIVLKAKTDVVVLDSPKGIILNTTGEIHLGKDESSEPMVHGDVLFQIVQDLIRQMRSVIKCGSSVGGFMDTQYVKRAESKLKELRSTKYYLQKQTKK